MLKFKYILLRGVGERWFVEGEYDDPVKLAKAAYILGLKHCPIRIDKEGEIEL